MKPMLMQSVKVWWSWFWCSLLLGIAGSIAVFAPFGLLAYVLGFFALGPNPQFTPMMALLGAVMYLAFLVSFIYVVLMVNAYAWNRLSLLRYKDFRVGLMVDQKKRDKFGKWDAVCLWWSLAWRQNVFAMAIVYFGALALFPLFAILILGQWLNLSIFLGVILAFVYMFVLFVMPFHLLLLNKKDGRYLAIVKPESK